MPIGIPAALAISGLAGAGSSVASSLLKPKQTPSTSTTNQNTTGSTSNYTQRIMTEEQQQLLPFLTQFSMQQMQDPSGRLAPLREGLRSKVNQNYSGADQALKAKLGRGDGKSGVMGLGQRQLETSRAQQLSGVDTDMAGMVIQEQDKGVSLAERILSQIFGQSSSGETNQQSTGTASGTQGVTQQNPWATGVGSGLDTLTTLMMMNKLLQQKP